MKISKIILYDEPTVPEIQLDRLKKFLTEIFSVEIEIRENFFQHSKKNIFKKIASTRIFNLKKPFERYIPSTREVLIEKENRWGFVDSKGRLRISNRYDGAGPFHEGLAPIMLRGKWGFIDKSGKTKIKQSATAGVTANATKKKPDARASGLAKQNDATWRAGNSDQDRPEYR